MFATHTPASDTFNVPVLQGLSEKAALALVTDRIAQERLRRPLPGMSLAANQQLAARFQQRAEQFRCAALQGR